MKKILSLLALPLALAACTDLTNVKGSTKTDNSGLSEESLSTNEYTAPTEDATPDSASKKTDEATAAATAAGQDLIYAGPKYYTGTPYKIEDVQYTPAEDMSYDQTGIAGIVPMELNGVATPNGEKFDTDAMIATSKTLPLPSIVKITNTDNGQSAVVRINNRGPFVNARLLDVSPAAAKQLGMTGQTKVHVQIMKDESQKVKDLTLAASAPAPTAETTTGAPAAAVAGSYTVQVGAYYSEESANAVAKSISSIGTAKVVQESGMYKIRFTDLNSEDAKKIIEKLRSEQNMAPGLLKDGRWLNPDTI